MWSKKGYRDMRDGRQDEKGLANPFVDVDTEVTNSELSQAEHTRTHLNVDDVSQSARAFLSENENPTFSDGKVLRINSDNNSSDDAHELQEGLGVINRIENDESKLDDLDQIAKNDPNLSTWSAADFRISASLLRGRSSLNNMSANTDTKISSSELILACKHGHVDTASALLESRSDPDSIDVDGRSALSWACTSSNIELVRLLLSFKANVDTLQYSDKHLYSTPLRKVLLT
mmetsp:Transcript_31789/g.51128  ORF Transcript_31789/g.51128 Transcript_31789/m.51128 type:complete len:232 (-) Transcript_31789:2409-3104(-)